MQSQKLHGIIDYLFFIILLLHYFVNFSTILFNRQIDPFGASSLSPTLYSMAGFQAMVGNRIPSKNKNNIYLIGNSISSFFLLLKYENRCCDGSMENISIFRIQLERFSRISSSTYIIHSYI